MWQRRWLYQVMAENIYQAARLTSVIIVTFVVNWVTCSPLLSKPVPQYSSDLQKLLMKWGMSELCRQLTGLDCLIGSQTTNSNQTKLSASCASMRYIWHDPILNTLSLFNTVSKNYWTTISLYFACKILTLNVQYFTVSFIAVLRETQLLFLVSI